MKSRVLLLLLLCVTSVFSYAAQKEEVSVFSPSMNRTIQTVVVSPERFGVERFPVVYLLHGYGGDQNSWSIICPDLQKLSDRYRMIFVCPDGENSWYWDSPEKDSVRYETFISSELIQYVDTHYPTIAGRQARAITGLSMGGHGALWNAIRHQDVFGAAGSTSGGVDIRPFTGNWEISKQLGSYANNKERWKSHTVMSLVDRLQPESLALIIDCGYDDFFFNVNKEFHELLLEKGIGHDFITRPGEHNPAYWQNSIQYQLLFFYRFFGDRVELVL